MYPSLKSKRWKTRHIDFEGAFLHATLEDGKDIWIRLPNIPGTSLRGQIVKLVKSLYGLRQAPKLWYEYLYRKLKKLGFSQSSPSDCLFLLLSSESVIMLVYIDDISVMGTEEEIEHLVAK